jgi:hypothetical protein
MRDLAMDMKSEVYGPKLPGNNHLTDSLYNGWFTQWLVYTMVGCYFPGKLGGLLKMPGDVDFKRENIHGGVSQT